MTERRRPLNKEEIAALAKEIVNQSSDHLCCLNLEERQLLKDMIKVLSTMKGNAIKGFAFGLFLVFLLGTVGIIWGVKSLIYLINP
jgi:hypothetical protein